MLHALLLLATIGADVPVTVSLQTAQATTITVTTIQMPSGQCRVIVKGQTMGAPSARFFAKDVMAACPVTVVFDGALKVNGGSGNLIPQGD